MASKVLDCKENTACFEGEWSSMPLRVKGSVANVGGGPHGAAGLLLVKRSPKTIDAGVVVHSEERESSSTTFRSGSTRTRESERSATNSRKMASMSGMNKN